MVARKAVVNEKPLRISKKQKTGKGRKRMRDLRVFFIIFFIGVLSVQPDITQALELESMPEIEGITEEMEEKSKKSWQGTFGLGAGIVPDYEGSSDYEIVPFPYTRVHWNTGRYAELEGLTLRANLLANPTWSLGPVARYAPGRDDVDNDAVDALRDVDDAFEVGAFLGVHSRNWNARIEALQDVADGHEGLLVNLRLGYARQIGAKSRFTFGASTTFADDDYMESFFSIDADNAMRSGLRVYDADSGIKDVGLDAAVGVSIGKDWSILTSFGYKRLLDEAKDSPVVDDEGDANQFSGGIVFLYSYY